jgi:hypothetical protein
MRNVMSKTKILTKQVQAIELNIADALEEKLNIQIEAAVTFSAQHGVNTELEFAKHHRKRVAPRRIDDTPENTVHFGLQTFYRKEFLQVLDAQILLLEDNLKVAFKIIEPAVSLLKPPYITKAKLFPEMCCR